ncbi:dephospho-CoA kinase [Candidatus Woesearchaeota archaeon CG10_big_fil_rev_8_21_14_0_10_34_8]|nr:MAG: dephospho-CoA kinase [Candidatus Woesearchaeota archaeon CG10_big_fil_rev_8_21_14_0_10_34_8]
MIIALVGMTGSGKTVAAGYITKKGFTLIYFGSLVMNMLKEQNLPITEANERKLREELRNEHGMEAFAKMHLSQISSALAKGNVIIDGMASQAEFEFLYSYFGKKLTVISMYTTKALRYRRLSTRSHRPLTGDQAVSRDISEIHNMDKGGPIALADYLVLNDDTLESLYHQLDKILKHIQERNNDD